MYLVNNSADAHLGFFFFLTSNHQRLLPVIKGAGNVPTYSQAPYGSSSRAAQIMKRFTDDIHSKVKVIRQFLAGEIFKKT